MRILSNVPPITSLMYGLLYRRNIFSNQFMARVKYNETSPQRIPSNITAGIRSMRKGSSMLYSNIALVPVSR